MINELPASIHSTLDSRRFGINVHRSRPGITASDIVQLERELCGGIDLLVLRVPSGEKSLPRLLRSGGYDVVYADSLVYYSTTLTPPQGDAGPPHSTPPGFEIKAPDHLDALAAGEICEAAFMGYQSHYAASPEFFGADLVARGYKEWALNHLTTLTPTKRGLVARTGGRVAGFITFELDESSESAEVLLNAVDESDRRKGIYSALLGATMAESAARGARTVRISTQLTNTGVQRAWTKLGFLISSSLDTYHVMRRAGQSLEERIP